MSFPRPWLSRLGVSALCLGFFLQGFFSSRIKSPTSDEPVHIFAATSYVTTRQIIVNPQHPPLLKELAGLSLALAGIRWHGAAGVLLGNHPIGWEWRAGNALIGSAGVGRTMFWARLPLLFVATLTGLLVYWWGRELAGPTAGLCATFLFAADPTMVAHSYLVTTDAGVTALGLLYLLALFRYFQKPSIGRVTLAGLTFGLALCTKFSAVFLLPITGILALAWLRPPVVRPGLKKRGKVLQKSPVPLSSFVKAMAILAVAAILVIQICYLSPAGPFLYLHGLGRVNADHRPDYEAYLGGQQQHRFNTYFAVAWFLKEPLATLLAAIGGMFLYFGAAGFPVCRNSSCSFPPSSFSWRVPSGPTISAFDT